jgi:hypothetical protein
MVNQIEIHPAWHPIEDINWCQSHDIVIQAYSSLGRAELLQENSEFLKKYDFLQSIAANHSYDVAASSVRLESAETNEGTYERKASLQQIFLRWAWEHGYGIIPKSRHSERVIQNAEAINCLQLNAAEMDQIDKIALPQADSDGLLQKTCWDPRIIR